MRTAIATLCLVTALVGLTAPAAAADVSVIGGGIAPPPVIDPYCDQKHPDPNDPIQDYYCGVWSAYYVMAHYLDNASVTDPVFTTISNGEKAAKLAVFCAQNWENATRCPYKLMDAL